MIFLESPWPILLIGIAVEAVLAILLLRSGQGRLLWAMLGVGLLVLAGLLVEHFVVTDRKMITNTLDSAAAAVAANDLDRVLEHISPTADSLRADIRQAFGRIEFRTARINGLEIAINRLTSPPTAKAKFHAIGSGRDRRGEFLHENFAEAVTVTLRQEGGRWLVAECRIDALNLP